MPRARVIEKSMDDLPLWATYHKDMAVQWRTDKSGWRNGVVAGLYDHAAHALPVFNGTECPDACEGERINVSLANVRRRPSES